MDRAQALNELYLQQLSSYFAVGATACVIYDHFITLDLEIDFVWKRDKKSIVQTLFFVIRYVGLAYHMYSAMVLASPFMGDNLNVSGKQSVTQVVLTYWATVLGLLMQAIMLFRVSSMYHHNRRFIWILAVAFTLEASIVFGFVSAGLHFRKTAIDPVSVLGIVQCSPKSFPKWTFFALVSVVGFEICIVLLSFRVAVQYYRSLDSGDGLRITPKGLTTLPFVFFRDSLTFPLLYCLLCLLNVISVVYVSNGLGTALLPIGRLAPSIIGTRLVLNLREAYYLPFPEECSVSVDGSIQFAQENNDEEIDSLYTA